VDAFSEYEFGMTSPVLPLTFAAGAARFDESLPGWTLLDEGLESGGARAFTGHIAFERTFAGPPVVQVGITGFDIDRGDNARLNVGILDIDERGFTLQLRTWWNTKLWSVDLNWLAIGH
jgi:hypothetical protein